SPNWSDSPSRNHCDRRTVRASHGLPEQLLPPTIRLEQHVPNLRTDYRPSLTRLRKRIPSLRALDGKTNRKTGRRVPTNLWPLSDYCSFHRYHSILQRVHF